MAGTQQKLEMSARSFIRHPTDIPIEVCIELAKPGITDNKTQGEGALNSQHQLQNYSIGGLSYVANNPLLLGENVCIRITLVHPIFEVRGRVKWCHKNADAYEIGVEFLDPDDGFKTRMVEQICHIEHYKREVLVTQGRKISGQEAALEWIGQFAAQFPFSSGDNNK